MKRPKSELPPLVPHPDIAPLLARMAEVAATRPPNHALTPSEFRQRMLDDARARAADAPAVPQVADVDAEGGCRGRIPIRLYSVEPLAEATAPRPVAVYLHGSGWIAGSLDTHDAIARRLALASGAVVASVDYALAPEHRFPGPLDDCIAAIGWLRAEGRRFGLDASRIAIVGDSAGANLAVAAAIAMRDRGLPAPRLVVSNYGVLTCDLRTESHRLLGDGRFGLSTAAMELYWNHYVGTDPAARRQPLAAPEFADPGGLPAMLIVGAGLDVLRDDSRRFAAKLALAGQPVRFIECAGLPHGFLHHAARASTVAAVFAMLGRELADALR